MKPIVAIANDHAGPALKAALVPVIRACGYDVLDLGTGTEDSVDYPDYGTAAAMAIKEGRAQFAIVICGSGIGISIAANRVPGIRAALCTSGAMAELARAHNDANILALGARLIGDVEAIDIVKRFLTTPHEGGERHARRIKKLG